MMKGYVPALAGLKAVDTDGLEIVFICSF